MELRLVGADKTGGRTALLAWVLVSIGPLGVAEGADVDLAARPVAAGLSLPIFVTHAPEDTTRLFIVEQGGRIRILDQDAGVLRPDPFLDIAADVVHWGEAGLLGLAFHPDYARNGFFYVHHTGGTHGDLESLSTVVARYQACPDDPNHAEAGTAHGVLWIDQPPTLTHKGGWIGFGPDGYLYVALGDGQDHCRAQATEGELLGKILRLDVDGDDFPEDVTRNYAVPRGNPLVGVPGDDEIWALGLRNPWRASFDRLTGDLYVADVGLGGPEEINVQPAASGGGDNYGWPCMEGSECRDPCPPGCPCCVCNDADLCLPIHEYLRPPGTQSAVMGGYVYRGTDIHDLGGTYFFADYGFGQIWSFRFDGSAVVGLRNRTPELAPPGGYLAIASFGEDGRGELYIVDRGGTVYRLVPGGPGGCPADVNEDGVTDIADLVAVLLAWGTADADGDVDGDGTVGVADLVAVILGWGRCGP